MELIVEITGFTSLEKIDRSFTDMILEKLNSLVNTESCINFRRQGSCLIFKYNTDLGDDGELAGAVIRGYEFLSSISDKLRGFVFVAGDDENGFLLKDVYRITCDGSFYVRQDVVELFRRYGDFVSEGEWFRLSSSERSDISRLEGVVDFVGSTDEYQVFLDMFTPFLNGEESGVFFFYGNEHSSGLPMLGYALTKSLEGSPEGKVFFPWLHIFPEKYDFSATAPLIRAMDKKFLSMISEYLTLSEERILNDLPLNSLRSDLIQEEEDAILMFRVYLSAYVGYFRHNGMPPIIFLDGVEDLDEDTAVIIAEVLKDMPDDNGLIPVLFSLQPDVPACFHDFNIFKYKYEDCIASVGRTTYSPVSAYHEYLLKEKDVSSDPDLPPEIKLLNGLSGFEKKMLFLVGITGEFAEPDELIDAVAEDDSAAVNYKSAYEDLVSMGYLYPGRNIPVFSGLPVNENGYISEAGITYVEHIYGAILNNRTKGPSFFRKIADAGAGLGLENRAMRFLLESADILIDRRNTEKALPMIKKVLSSVSDPEKDESGLYVHANILFLKAALIDSRVHLVDDLARNILDAGDSNDNVLEVSRNLVLGEYYYSKYEFRKSLIHAKKSLLDSQNNTGHTGESEANSLIGKIMLGMQRIEEAKDYFRISRETVPEVGYGLLPVKTVYLESVSHYIYGNVSESLRLIERGLELCTRYGLRNWQILYGFLKGRVYFDLGKYYDAAEIFSQCLAVDRIYQNAGGNGVIYPWLARSLVYGGSRREGASILEDYKDNAEGLFFYAEYLYFEREFSSALDMTVRSLEINNDRMHLFISPDFVLEDSGFEYVEDLVFIEDTGYGVLRHLLEAFRAFLVVLNGKPSEGISDLMRLTRDEKLSDIDPFNGLYHFLHALSLPESSGDDTLDRLTLLSKSLRHVQTVASRIDTPSDRRAFLENSYWNARLIETCKKNKLL